jgi:DNA-binding IclR family transcriptional regulator
MSDEVVVLARTPGPGAFQLTESVGVVRPAYCTALGKVILAALRPDQLNRYLDRVELKSLAAKTIIGKQRLRAELEDVRRNGIAYDDGEFNDEVRCAAMPVRDFSGQVVGAIGISGPVWRLSIQALQNHARSLSGAAYRLSEAFGASGQNIPLR